MGLEEMINELNRIRATARTESSALATEFINLLIPRMNKVGCKKVVITAYTPYFNDGDPCEYGICSVEGFKSEDFDDYQNFYDYPDETLSWEEMRDITSFIEGAQEIFELIFGEGLFVISADGSFHEEEYDHD